MSVVLALDLGLTTGYAVGVPGRAPQFGCLRLPGPAAGFGARFGALTNGISDLIVTHRPALIAKEAILRLAAQNSAHIARLQFGYQACADEEAWRHNVATVEADADAIRKSIIGRSRWPKGTDVKAKVIEWCREHGIDVRQSDQADAIVTWFWACETHAGALRRKAA
jgi:hypothetical protein